MPINFPTSLDTLTNPVATDSTVAVSHSGQHSNANDAIEALEAKVGADSSAVTTSHDYKLSLITGTKKALPDVSPTITTPTINVGSDATGDIYYRHSDGTLKRLAVSTDGKILKLASGIPSWATETVTSDASTTVKGIAEEATLAEIDANTAAGDTGARLFVNPSTLGKTIDGTFADNSDAKIPSQKAIKTYVDTKLGGLKYDGKLSFAAEGAKTYTLGATYDRVMIEIDLALSEAMTLSMIFNSDTGATDYTTTTMDNDSVQTGATAANMSVIVVGGESSFSATYHISGKISGIRKFIWGQGATNTTTNAIMVRGMHLHTGDGDLATFTLTPSAGTLTGTVKVFGITY